MRRGLLLLTASLLASAATLAAQDPAPPSPQDAPRAFRVSVDVVAVDVQVIDRDGRPVPDLGPEKFTVTINGRKRRVITAERIESYAPEGGNRSVTSTGAPTTAAELGRVIVLAIDCISFDVTASKALIESTRQFIRKLSPNDFLGLYAYPNGPKLNPTRDHDAVIRALRSVVGQRETQGLSQFTVRPAEIIDITKELIRGGGDTVERVV